MGTGGAKRVRQRWRPAPQRWPVDRTQARRHASARPCGVQARRRRHGNGLIGVRARQHRETRVVTPTRLLVAFFALLVALALALLVGRARSRCGDPCLLGCLRGLYRLTHADQHARTRHAQVLASGASATQSAAKNRLACARARAAAGGCSRSARTANGRHGNADAPRLHSGRL